MTAAMSAGDWPSSASRTYSKPPTWPKTEMEGGLSANMLPSRDGHERASSAACAVATECKSAGRALVIGLQAHENDAAVGGRAAAEEVETEDAGDGFRPADPCG